MTWTLHLDGRPIDLSDDEGRELEFRLRHVGGPAGGYVVFQPSSLSGNEIRIGGNSDVRLERAPE